MTTPSAHRVDYRDLAYSALGAGLIIALGAAPAIPIGFLPVPVTLQSLGVMLVGLILGPWRGLAAVAAVIALVAMGFPVLAGGRGGMAVLVGPTAGYMIGWLIGAFLTGWVAQRAEAIDGVWRRRLIVFAGCFFGGVIVVHVAGVCWLALVTGIGWAKAALGTLLFVPGDLVKAVIAVVVAERITALVSIRRA